MTEFKIDLTDAIQTAESTARKMADNSISAAATTVVNDLLSSGRFRGKEGLAHEIIRKRIEEYVLSDEFEKKIDTIIESVIDDEATKAIRVLLNSKTRKHLFVATAPANNQSLEYRQDDPYARWVIVRVYNTTVAWDGSEFSDMKDLNTIRLFTWDERQKTKLPDEGVWMLYPGRW